MTVRITDHDRAIIPRWRSIRDAEDLGELDPTAPQNRAPQRVELLESKAADWRERRGVLGIAGDLLGTSLATTTASADAVDAARYVITEATASRNLRQLAARVLEQLGDQLSLSFDAETNDDPQKGSLRRYVVHRLRKQLRDSPRSALLWSELSREYAILGQSERSVAAMEMALRLAPNNRFVLRSAARLFVHVHDAGYAIDLLRRASRSQSDAWLIAAEVGISGLAKRPSQLARAGLRLLEAGGIPPFHTADLASALGTLEASAGSNRKAKRLFVQSLTKPTENAVAQAQWAAHKRHLIDFDEQLLVTPRSYEARAAEHLEAGAFEAAFSEAFHWSGDQPFSRTPAIFGSYVAAVGMNDQERALELIDAGLIANRSDWLLLNNRAFSLATIGRLTEAAATFRRIKVNESDSQQVATLMATGGLLGFRSGDVAEGRKLYRGAIERFERVESWRAAAVAAVFLAREEFIAATEMAAQALKEAEQRAARVSTPEVTAQLQLLRVRDTSTPQE